MMREDIAALDMWKAILQGERNLEIKKIQQVQHNTSDENQAFLNLLWVKSEYDAFKLKHDVVRDWAKIELNKMKQVKRDLEEQVHDKLCKGLKNHAIARIEQTLWIFMNSFKAKDHMKHIFTSEGTSA